MSPLHLGERRKPETELCRNITSGYRCINCDNMAQCNNVGNGHGNVSQGPNQVVDATGRVLLCDIIRPKYNM